MINTAIQDQRTMLQYLHDRFVNGDERFCTLPTIRKKTGMTGADQYLRVLADDLETAGMIITRQAYQMSGGRLFQITAKGIDEIAYGSASKPIDSSAWTGDFNLSLSQKEKITSILAEIRAEIDKSKLSNSKKANALALVKAAEALVDAPDPLWPEIMRLLRSQLLGNIAGVASLVFAIVQILKSA